MDDGAIDRATQRIEQRAEAAAIDTLLERARVNLETLIAAADEAAASVPDRVDEAIRDGLRDQVTPVTRNLAEVRGLMNQLLRRLERLEGDSAAERHARVDDLALLVELISSGWKNVDTRVGRIEASIERLEQGLEERGGAIIYRIEERR
jgi:hypothetical protein